jgi:hypothetical protein
LLRGGDRREDERNLPADDVYDRLAAALIRDVLQRNAGALLQKLAGKVRRPARARCAVWKRGRLRFFREGDKTGEIFRRQRRVRDEEQVAVAELGHRSEVPECIERKLGEHVRVDDHRTVEAEHQRIAVRRRLCDELRPDVAACARAVLDNDLLAQPRRERVSNNARAVVGHAPGRERHDDPYRLDGVRLRKHGGTRQQCCYEKCDSDHAMANGEWRRG